MGAYKYAGPYAAYLSERKRPLQGTLDAPGPKLARQAGVGTAGRGTQIKEELLSAAVLQAF